MLIGLCCSCCCCSSKKKTRDDRGVQRIVLLVLILIVIVCSYLGCAWMMVSSAQMDRGGQEIQQVGGSIVKLVLLNINNNIGNSPHSA